MSEQKESRNSGVEILKPFNLRISFTGLCAFVPRGEDDSKIERMDVLLVNPASFEEYAEDHQATLTFFLKNLRGAAEDGDLKDTQGFWDLDKENLALYLLHRVTGEETPLEGRVHLRGGRKFKDKPRLDPMIPEEEQARDLKLQEADFSWLPEIDKSLDGRAGEVNAEILDAVDPSYAVNARFRVSSGFFGSHFLGTVLGDYVVAQFVPPAQSENPYSQAVAHWAGVDVEIDSTYDVLLRATKYSGSPSRDLILRATPGGTLEIKVTNLCCGYYGRETTSPRYLEPDQDYRHFYILSANYLEIHNEYPRLPIPVAVSYRASLQNRGNTGGVNPIRCSGTRFKPIPLGAAGDPGNVPEESRKVVERLKKNQERLSAWFSL